MIHFDRDGKPVRRVIGAGRVGRSCDDKVLVSLYFCFWSPWPRSASSHRSVIRRSGARRKSVVVLGT